MYSFPKARWQHKDKARQCTARSVYVKEVLLTQTFSNTLYTKAKWEKHVGVEVSKRRISN